MIGALPAYRGNMSIPSRVAVVLPTYNEAGNIRAMLAAIRDALPSASVLVVDDGSPDGTGEIADDAAMHDAGVAVLHRADKQGLGAAYRAGFAAVLEKPGVDIVMQMDCDFSHDPADLVRLVACIESGADLAIGSRYVFGGGTPGWNWRRRLVSRGGNLFARSTLRLPVRDLTGGFKAWRRTTLAAALEGDGNALGYGFQIEMTWKAMHAGARIVEIPITFRDRTVGMSKMTGRIAGEALRLVIRLAVRDIRRRRGGRT